MTSPPQGAGAAAPAPGPQQSSQQGASAGGSTAGKTAAIRPKRRARRSAGRGASPSSAAPASTAVRSTPETLRRLSAYGMLAGVLTGAAAFGAITIGENAAQASAARLSTASAAAHAAATVDATRVTVSDAFLGGTAATSEQVQTAIGDSTVALAAVPPGADTEQVIATAQRAFAAYGAAAPAAVAAGGPQDSAAARSLHTADAALADAMTSLRTTTQTQGTDAATTGLYATALPILVGGASLVLLVGTGWWLARRTRRVINPSLATGTLLVALTTAAGIAGAAGPANALAGAGETGYLAPAYTAGAAAADARAAELSALLPGATVSAATTQAQDANSRVSNAITGNGVTQQARTAWSDYLVAQQRSLSAAATNRTTAISTATTSGQTTYAALAQALPIDAAQATDAAIPDVGDGTPWPWLALLAGIAGGSLAWIGLDRRLKDYR